MWSNSNSCHEKRARPYIARIYGSRVRSCSRRFRANLLEPQFSRYHECCFYKCYYNQHIKINMQSKLLYYRCAKGMVGANEASSESRSVKCRCGAVLTNFTPIKTISRRCDVETFCG